MDNIKKEKVIYSYFNMWVQRDFFLLDTLFEENIYYSECYGPEYFGLAEIHLWINDMLKKQRVMEWTVKRFIHAKETIIVEWFFQDKQSAFDGVSIIEFTENEKIMSIKEFESKIPHIAPYAHF